MKKAKFFRYHVLGLLFWVILVITTWVVACHLSLPYRLQDSAVEDGLGLMIFPGFGLIAWLFTLTQLAIGGAYDEPTEWDELIDKAKENRKEGADGSK